MLIIHGDNQIATREQILSFKSSQQSKEKYIIELDTGSLTVNSLENALRSTSLLGNSGAVFIQDLFSSRPSRNKKEIIEYLINNPKADIFIWESRDITRQLKGFPASAVRKFSLGSDLFKFLDNINLYTLQAALENTPIEQLFVLLADRIRKLIIIKSPASKNKTVLNLATWQLQKLTKQAGGYSMEQLITMLKQLLEIDFRQKTSRMPYNLAAALELWVTKL